MVDCANIWDGGGDLLQRQPEADFLQAFLVRQIEKRSSAGKTAGYVLNIDAEWGAGKTFFLERFAKQLVRHGHIVAQVNAWQDDHTDEPFVAVLSAIDEAITPLLTDNGKSKELWKKVTRSAGPAMGRIIVGAARTATKRYIGTEIDCLISDDNDSHLDEALAEGAKDAVKQVLKPFDRDAEIMISAFKEQKTAIEKFRTRLDVAIAHLGDRKKLPLFVLIDELDRCRPNYAVALLERTKHLFEVNNVVFVFATNSGQLQHGVAGAYGPKFDGYRYLQRFFDGTYKLRSPSKRQFIELELKNLPQEKLHIPASDFAEFFETIVEEFNMQLREIQRVAELIENVVDAWGDRAPIESVLLLPLAINFVRAGNAEWDLAINCIPKKYMLTRQSPDRFRPPEEINFKSLFEQILRLSTNIDSVIDFMSEDHRDWKGIYLSNAFVSEVNGVPITRGKPSVQMKLPDLISCAGRLAESSDDTAAN